MKTTFKILTVLAAILLVASTCFAQAPKSTTINLSLYLNEYIETMPGPVNVNLGTTTHQSYYGNEEWYYNTSPQSWNIAYANCPFSVTVAGDNPAGQGKPRFARQEVGPHSNGYDVIPTLYSIYFTTNGVSNLFYGTWLQGAHQFPYTKQYAEAPHNGQVKMDLNIWANATIASEAVPVRQTLINPAYTWDKSADAGNYTCNMTVTLGAF
ncbi:MAG: hypothetical protein WC447_02340 [Candidatus Paceibacterota bacterium]